MPSLKIDIGNQGPVTASRKQRIAPCEQQVIQKLQILKEIANNDPNNYYPTMARYGLESYWFYLRIILDYRWLDPWDHGEEQIPFLEEDPDAWKLFLVPRGSGKTGSISVPLWPWKLAKDPTFTGIITNSRDEKASEFARQAAGIITDCKNFNLCYPQVVASEKWGERGYRLDLVKGLGEARGSLGRADPSIQMYGVGGNITGSHVRGIIHDDLINETTSQSPAGREKAKLFLTESFNTIDPGGTMIICGTRWHFADFYGEIQNDKIVGPKGDFKIFIRGAERYVIGDDGQPVLEVFNAHRTYVDMRGIKKEVGYTQAYLEAQKKNLGSQYHALYQNTPISDADRQFDVERIQQFYEAPADLGPVSRVGIETEGQAQIILPEIQKMMRSENRLFSVEKINWGKNLEKHDRIRAILQPLIDRGDLHIRDDIWRAENGLGQELRLFDKWEDDALDALTMCVKYAQKYIPGKPPLIYIAVDPAFTVKAASNSTAIVSGCWIEDGFYVLDCLKFKAQKIESIARGIFKVYDKYARNKQGASVPGTKVPGFYSQGNRPAIRRQPQGRFGNVWGDEEENKSLTEKISRR